MYATGGVRCPVASFEKYLQHLNPKNEFLFQRPRKKVSSSSVVWYDNMIVGERLLGDMMKRISKEAKLSRIYTNHSIRATAVTILHKSGFEARHIMTVSGHRYESSIRAYSKTDQTTKKRMSETLTAAGASNSTHNEDSARLETLTAENISLSPLLTLSQEEHVMRDLDFQTFHSQVSKNFAFYNCNVSSVRLNYLLLFTFSNSFHSIFTYCQCLEVFVNRIMGRSFVYLYTLTNKLPVPLSVMTIFFFVECIIKQLLDEVFVISRIIKVSVRVISLSHRLRLITLTSTLIIQ